MLKKLLLAVAAYFYFVLAAQARVYYLPDYQMSFGNRSSQSDTNTSTSTHKPTCSAYGYYTANSRPSNAECSKVSIPGLTCYSCTVCASSFSYNSSNCSGEYVLSGNSCGGNYNKCICDPTKYITTEDGGGCKEGETADTSKSCINKTDGKTLYQCVKDPCYGLADNETELGCDKYYDQCPSKCELGSTCKPTDCSAYTLTSCPSGSTCESCTPGCGDNAKRYKCTPKSCSGYTLASCPTGSNCETCTPGCGNNTKKYKCLPRNCSGYTLSSCPAGSICGSCAPGCGNNTTKYKVFKGLAFQVDSPAKGKIAFTITGNNWRIDWGDGNVDTSKSHTYTTAGLYNIEVSGGVKTFSINYRPTAKPIKLHSLNLSQVTSMSFAGGCSTLTGTIPALPSSLTNGLNLFFGCTGLTGEIPELPTKLTNGRNMFSGCDGLTGTIPELPSGLTDGVSMFWDCSGLSGNIPALPTTLDDGRWMFQGCSGLTGNIPKLPDKMLYGDGMFQWCSGLTGSIPALPSGLEYAREMFSECSGLTGGIPPLPSGLFDGDFMFENCSGLSGQTPIKPASLTLYNKTFFGTQVTNDGSWPDSAW